MWLAHSDMRISPSISAHILKYSLAKMNRSLANFLLFQYLRTYFTVLIISILLLKILTV